MTLYFDTSALVKLLIPEDGSATARRLWGVPAPPFTSPLAYAEARAALAAAHRAERLSRNALTRATRFLDRLWTELRTVALDDALATRAGELAERYGLSGGDAVHLASALSVADGDLVVATWDRELARAAQALGRAVAPA